jgi:hypothetical protein
MTKIVAPILGLIGMLFASIAAEANGGRNQECSYPVDCRSNALSLEGQVSQNCRRAGGSRKQCAKAASDARNNILRQCVNDGSAACNLGLVCLRAGGAHPSVCCMRDEHEFNGRCVPNPAAFNPCSICWTQGKVCSALKRCYDPRSCSPGAFICDHIDVRIGPTCCLIGDRCDSGKMGDVVNWGCRRMQ